MPRAADVIPDLTLRFIDNGRYQLIDKLGSGGFGVVYRGRERIPDTHRYVYRAIKVIPRATPKSHQANCQKREAYLHHAVSGHPNVVCLLNMTHDERYMYYIMEYCSGGDLHRAINKHQPFARNDLLVKHTFLQMLDAVEACHKKSVFHRDLKPENILLSEDGLRVKLCDFGLATQSRQSTTFKTGTYRYMSPECVDCDEQHAPYDCVRSDIWALALILFVLVTGRHHPWEKATLEDRAFVSFLEEPNYLRNSYPISQAFSDLLRRVLTIRPQDMLTISEFRKAVRNMGSFYMSESEIAASNGTVQKVWRTYRPRLYAQGESVDDSDSDSECDGDVLESDTSSESTDPQAASSQHSGEKKPAILRPASRTAREEPAPLPQPAPLGPPAVLAMAADPTPLVRPIPKTNSSDEFPIRRPAAAYIAKEGVPDSPVTPVTPVLSPARNSGPKSSPSSATSSGPPATPPTYAQDAANIVIAEPLDDAVVRVDLSEAVARVGGMKKGQDGAGAKNVLNVIVETVAFDIVSP